MVPGNTSRVAVEVIAEEEVAGGWSHTVRITRPGGQESTHTVRLAWVDHDHWSGGARAPSRVTEAVVQLLASYEPILELPDRFDAATSRRWLPGIDDQLGRVL